MPRKPVLMVLYTNDAVEVRYSDDSRLHILPCGTSFSYHSPQNAHPVHGLSSVQQRCCFVTSSYRDMLLAALDFRNRFSERPFLSCDLMNSEQVVNLYANIEKIAWPKQVDKDHCAILDDGSVRITSVDEFASLILSPHRKDFTVCYLSLMSEDKIREKSKSRQQKSDKVRDRDRHNQHGVDENTANVSNDSHRSDTSDEVARIDQERLDRLAALDQMTAVKQQGPEDLNISPITQASCVGNSPDSHASGSPVTPCNARKEPDAKFRPFSTPTEGIEYEQEEPVCTPYGKTAVFQDYNRNCVQTGRVEDDGRYKKSHNTNTGGTNHSTFPQKSCHVAASTIKSNTRHASHEYVAHGNKSSSRTKQDHSQDVSTDSCGSQGSCDSRDGRAEVRQRYCWVTRHVSCDECPLVWSHVVKMAQDLAQNGLSAFIKDQESGKSKNKENQHFPKQHPLRKISRERCAFSSLPHPLPLTCPGLHLHKNQSARMYSDGKNPSEDPTTLSQGRLKVILMNGTVYRLVRLPTIKLVEVYPGDGSVLLSQGMTGHFFLHIIPHDGKLEERTYSIKSLPSSMAGSHSIKSLIGRAHRFLAQVLQEDTSMSVPQGLCCWKHEETELIQPLATSVLEECNLIGCGKFTAMSNGQVRVVFHDRTSLDMTWDFSRRLQTCLEHSQQAEAGLTVVGGTQADTCRLLLPNGQYVLVERSQPGIYKRYVEMAKEWAEWVNASPEHRKLFYKDQPAKTSHMSVERELQKISCFNYIVDSTVFRKPDASLDQHSAGAFKPYGNSSTVTKQGILRNSDQNKLTKSSYNSSASIVQRPRNVHIRSPPSAWKTNSYSDQSKTSSTESTNLIGLSSISASQAPPTSTRPNPIGQLSNVSSLDGFNAVRDALFRTSSVIKDIDSMLDKK